MKHRMKVVKGFGGIRICFDAGDLVEASFADGYYTVFPLGRTSPSLDLVPGHYLEALDYSGE